MELAQVALSFLFELWMSFHPGCCPVGIKRSQRGVLGVRAGAGLVTCSRKFEALVPAGSRNESREQEAQAEGGRVRRGLPPDVPEDTLPLPTQGCQTRLCRFWLPEVERVTVSPWASLLIQSLVWIKLRLTGQYCFS